jgi:hypothetical protein
MVAFVNRRHGLFSRIYELRMRTGMSVTPNGQRDRPTLVEQELQQEVAAFYQGGEPARVRRLLGRPIDEIAP